MQLSHGSLRRMKCSAHRDDKEANKLIIAVYVYKRHTHHLNMESEQVPSDPEIKIPRKENQFA
jgi:hypothetical protein